MNIKTLSIVAMLAFLALFASLNWSAIMAPTALSLGIADFTAPLGLILLLVTATVAGLFFVYIVFQQAGIILEARRNAKELKGQRELADKAEASRFTELRAFLEAELGRLASQGTAATRELGIRCDQIEQEVRNAIDESVRTTTAYLGEIEDKLDRMMPTATR